MNMDELTNNKIFFQAYNIGLINQERYEQFKEEESNLANAIQLLKDIKKSAFKWRSCLNLQGTKSIDIKK